MNNYAQQFSANYGIDSDAARQVKAIRDGLIKAKAQQKTWFAQADADLPSSATIADATKPGAYYQGAIALITDSNCASACLDVADEILAMRGAIHLGLPTGADTIYNDVGFVDIGDGLELVLPLKVFRQRTRGHNQPLIPQYRYDGDISDTAAVQAWALRILNE